MEREAEAKDNLWRARLDAVLMHRIWGSLIFLGIVYIIFFLSFAIGDPLVRLIQTGTQLFSVWACRMLEPWPRLQSLLGEGVVGGVGGVLAFLPNVVLLSGAITVLENSGYMMRVSRLMSRIMKIMGLNGSSFAPLLLGFGCTALFLLLGRPAGRLLFHSELAGSFILTLSFICPFMYIASTLGSILNGLGKTAQTFLYSVVSLLLRLLFVFIAIPHYGIKGYLWGMLASQMLQTLLCTVSALHISHRSQMR